MYKQDIENLSKYLQSFPKVSLFISTSTIDKTDCIKFVGESLSLEVKDITEDISYEFLNDLYLQTDRFIYTMDLDSLTIAKQNSILKFTEDCPSNCYLILTASYKTVVIPTILTRCVLFELHKYSGEEIAKYVDSSDYSNKDLLKAISSTVDDVVDFSKFDLQSLYDLCVNIVNNLSNATLPNTLSISSKYLYYKDAEDGKYNTDVFSAMLSYVLLKSLKDTRENIVYQMYMQLVKFRDKLLNKSLSREYLVYELLLRLWKISRGEFFED